MPDENEPAVYHGIFVRFLQKWPASVVLFFYLIDRGIDHIIYPFLMQNPEERIHLLKLPIFIALVIILLAMLGAIIYMVVTRFTKLPKPRYFYLQLLISVYLLYSFVAWRYD